MTKIRSCTQRSRPPQRYRALCTYGVAVAALGLCAHTSSASFEAASAQWQGTSSLLELARDRLGSSRVILAQTLAWTELTPADGVLILHPLSDLSLDDSSAFLASGGRLALVDDYGRGDRVLRHYRLRRVLGPTQPAQSLRDNPELAIATPAHDDGDPEQVHPIVAKVDRVVTNHPTVILPDAGLELTPILNIEVTGEPPALLAALGVIGSTHGCQLQRGNDVPSSPADGGDVVPCGRFFAMTDPSVFINLMMRYPGNRALAAGLVDYLVADDTWGTRGGKLYVLANQFDQSGSYDHEQGWWASLADGKRRAIQLLEQLRTAGMPGYVAQVLASLAALVVIGWALLRAARLQAKRLPNYTRLLPAVAQGGSYGRAAVLSARTTERALVVLELKSALEEALCHRLELRRGTSHDAIVEAVRVGHKLAPPMIARLSATLGQTRRAEARVMGSTSLSFSDSQVAELSRSVHEILAALEHRSVRQQRRQR